MTAIIYPVRGVDATKSPDDPLRYNRPKAPLHCLLGFRKSSTAIAFLIPPIGIKTMCHESGWLLREAALVIYCKFLDKKYKLFKCRRLYISSGYFSFGLVLTLGANDSTLTSLTGYLAHHRCCPLPTFTSGLQSTLLVNVVLQI